MLFIIGDGIQMKEVEKIKVCVTCEADGTFPAREI